MNQGGRTGAGDTFRGMQHYPLHPNVFLRCTAVCDGGVQRRTRVVVQRRALGPRIWQRTARTIRTAQKQKSMWSWTGASHGGRGCLAALSEVHECVATSGMHLSPLECSSVVCSEFLLMLRIATCAAVETCLSIVKLGNGKSGACAGS